jgi:citrate lyase subunit beta/citryl-CoA lyase
MRHIRSLLFAPANRPDLLLKFPRYAADAFAIDMEDATPEAEKAAARNALPPIVEQLREQGLESQLFIRTNAPRSRHADEDLHAALDMPVDGVMVPKLENIADLARFSAVVGSAEKRGARTLQLLGVIETPRGVMNVEALATAPDSRLTALAFGAEDFITGLGGRRTPESREVLYARSRVVLAARSQGLQALDQVCVNIRDDEAFRLDAEAGRELGFSGKMCIAPRQIEIANAVFSPSAEEIDRSRRLIEAYDKAQAIGRGVFEFEGNMVDEPVLQRARAILELAQHPDGV